MKPKIITAAELAAANRRGKPVKTTVVSYERSMYARRHPQALKNLTIEKFAQQFCGQIERSGITKTDIRHMRNLITLFEDVIAEAGAE